MTSNSLHLKLQLLRVLKVGKIQQIQTLIQKIRDVPHLNPQLYDKFTKFVSQNKTGLIQMQQEEQQENKPSNIVIQNINGQLKQDNDNSCDSSSDDSDDEQSELKPSISHLNQPAILKQTHNKHNAKPTSTLNTKKPTQKINPKLAFKKHAIKATPSTTTQPVKVTPKTRN